MGQLSLSQGKTLGEIGSILVFIPFVNIVGYILILIAINDISSGVQNRAIFNNALIAIAVEIVGIAVALFLLVAGSLTSVFTGGLSAIVGVLAGLVVVWLVLVLAAVFFRRSYDGIASTLGVRQFRTAGSLYLVGALLLIAFGLGAIVIFVAYIFQAIAYFSIPDQPGHSFQSAQPVWTPSTPAATQASAPQPTRFCQACGAPNITSARFCVSCGQPLNPL